MCLPRSMRAWGRNAAGAGKKKEIVRWSSGIPGVATPGLEEETTKRFLPALRCYGFAAAGDSLSMAGAAKGAAIGFGAQAAFLATGNFMVNAVPLPTVLSTRMRP